MLNVHYVEIQLFEFTSTGLPQIALNLKSFALFTKQVNFAMVSRCRVRMFKEKKQICVLAVLQIFLMSCTSQSYDPSAYWIDVICSVQHTQTIDIYGIFGDGTTPVAEFFEELSRGVGKKCQVALTLKGYFETAEKIKERNRLLQGRISKAHIEKKFTDNAVSIWRTNLILLSNGDSLERILDDEGNLTFVWNPRDHFIVLLISDAETSTNLSTINRILRSLWFRCQIQNVLLSMPLLTTTNRLVYSYDPFVRIGDEEWGRVESFVVDSATSVLDILRSLTPQRMKNLNGYALNVGLYEPASERVKPDNANHLNLTPVFDVDGFTLGIVAAHLNFRMNLIRPENDLKFGYQAKNGTYVGTLGDVVYGRVNISFVSFFIKTYGHSNRNDVEFTTYVEFDRLCVVVPRAQEIPKWARIYHLFQPSTWLYFGLCHLVVHLSWYFLETLDPRRKTPVDLQTSTFRTFLLYSGCPVKLPSSSSQRILLVGVFVASTTIIGLFSGVLYKSLARNMYYREINLLSELDESGLSITYGSLGLKDVFDSSENDATETSPWSTVDNNLKMKLIHAHGGIRQVALFRNTSALMRKNHFPVVDDSFIESDGTHQLHLSTECPRTYYLAYLLPKNSILRDTINGIVSRLNQAGLPTRWNQIYVKTAIDRNREFYKTRTEVQWRDEHAAFKLTDVQTSFYTLIIGLVLSTLAFIVERASQTNISAYRYQYLAKLYPWVCFEINKKSTK